MNQVGDLVETPWKLFFYVEYKWQELMYYVNELKRIAIVYDDLQNKIKDNQNFTLSEYNKILQNDGWTKNKINELMKSINSVLQDQKNKTAPESVTNEIRLLKKNLKYKISYIEENLNYEKRKTENVFPVNNNRSTNTDSIRQKKYVPENYNESRNIDTTHQKLLVNQVSSKFWIYDSSDVNQTPINVVGIKHSVLGTNQAQLIEGNDHKFQYG